MEYPDELEFLGTSLWVEKNAIQIPQNIHKIPKVARNLRLTYSCNFSFKVFSRTLELKVGFNQFLLLRLKNGPPFLAILCWGCESLLAMPSNTSKSICSNSDEDPLLDILGLWLRTLPLSRLLFRSIAIRLKTKATNIETHYLTRDTVLNNIMHYLLKKINHKG